MTRVYHRCDTRRGRQAYNVLVIPKDVFLEDVASSLGAYGQFQVYSIPRTAIKATAAAFLPPAIDDNFYVSSDPAVQRCKDAYRSFLSKMWAVFAHLLRIDAVVTGNYSYYAERELATALEERGVPFVAMHKENMKSPGRVDFFIDVYRQRRGPFTGRRIVVYNTVERDVQILAGVVTPERVTVCGMPRLDRVHDWRRENAGSRSPLECPAQVLLFSFMEKTGLPRMGRKGRSGFTSLGEPLDQNLESLSWSELFRSTHLAFVRFARENPNVRVIVKTKVREREWGPVEEILGEPDCRPTNLRVVRGGDPFNLITDSEVVCGFNTTGLLEAIAAGKAVIVPRFGEALDPEMQRYVISLGDAVEYADSPDDLTRRLKHHASARVPVPAELGSTRVEALQHWCGNSDGRAGERVCRVLRAEIVDDMGPALGAQIDAE